MNWGRSYNYSYPVHNAGVPLACPVHTGERSRTWAERVDRVFYVSVIDGTRKGILLGPYGTHAEALDNVARGRDLAFAAIPAAWFYSFGTCSAPRSAPLRPAFAQEQAA